MDGGPIVNFLQDHTSKLLVFLREDQTVVRMEPVVLTVLVGILFQIYCPNIG